jgi:CheY-like chemotaxis protein
VESYQSAEKSLNMIKGAPDIIFLDYNLSVDNKVMDGLMALGSFKKHFPNSSIIMMSSEENKHWLEQGQKYGANGYLTKTKDGLFDLEKVVTDFRIRRKKS